MSNTDRSGGSGQGKKPVIRVQRRRPTGPAAPEGRQRAEAPHREGREEPSGAAPRYTPPADAERQSTGAGQQWTTPGTRATSGLPIPSLSKRTMLIIGALALLCICAFGAYMLLGQGGGDGGEGDTTDQGFAFPTEAPAQFPTVAPSIPTATTKPFVAPTRSASGQTWLVMLYQDADDKVLEQDIYLDLNEAERVGSSDRIQIVAQVDRFAGAYYGDGDWTGTRRYYITQDDDLQSVNSELVADLGEVNMSDGDSLVDFVVWATETFPADRQVLILSDHGLGWPGGWSDSGTSGSTDRSTPLSSALGDQLYLMELDDALQAVRDRTGIDKFEMVGMDACLMGHLEVLSALAPHARYSVVSQEVEPALGWAYASFLQALQDDPDMTGAELGKFIVDSYVQEDQRIVDDEARAELLQQSSPLGGLFGYASQADATTLARQMGRDATLTAADLTALPTLIDSVNELSFALQQADQSQVARARTYAQSFTSIFGSQVPASYIDLGHFAQLLKQTGSGSQVDAAADNLLAALPQVVVAEKHGGGKPGATGVSVYFPNSQLYRSAAAGPQSYTAIASRFAGESLWDDFLAFHYTGRAFDAMERTAAVPDAGSSVTGPGSGAIEITPIQVSDTVAAIGRPVILSTDISGENLGYVYFFTGFHDQQSSSIFVADMDYLQSADTREVGGVYYPVWPEGEFTMEFEWEPLVFAISDGTTYVNAALEPVDYGVAPEEATYSVDGIYTDSNGESQHARLYFRDGWLRQAYGFTGQDETGAPHEILPMTGDTFTVLETWLDLDAQGNVTERVYQEGGTLTFGDQMFTWQELDAAQGDYVLGFVAEDLDGNSQEVYTTVTVE